jgi:hypothetical protein
MCTSKCAPDGARESGSDAPVTGDAPAAETSTSDAPAATDTSTSDATAD